MDIIIKNKSDEPIYQQIYNQIKDKVLKGILKEGFALPSIRKLAKELKVSVITTQKAYNELEANGYAYTIKTKGTFIAAQDIELKKEQQLKEIEHNLNIAISKAKVIKLKPSDVQEMIDLLWEDSDE